MVSGLFFKQVPNILVKYFQIFFFSTGGIFFAQEESQYVSIFNISPKLLTTAHSTFKNSHQFSCVKTGRVAGAQVQPPDTVFALLFSQS